MQSIVLLCLSILRASSLEEITVGSETINSICHLVGGMYLITTMVDSYRQMPFNDHHDVFDKYASIPLADKAARLNLEDLS